MSGSRLAQGFGGRRQDLRNPDGFRQVARDAEVHANLSSFIDHFLRHEEEENLLLQEFIASENAALP